MKIFIYLALLISYLNAVSQNRIHFIAQPQFNFNTLQTKDVLGYMGGIQYSYNIKDKNHVNIGILYGQQDGLYLCDSTSSFTSQGQICITTQRKKASYLVIPIWIDFPIINSTNNFIGGVGLQYNFLLNQQINWRNNYKKGFINLLLQTGYSFEISKKLGMNVLANYQHSINNIRVNFREYYNVLGINYSLFISI